TPFLSRIAIPDSCRSNFLPFYHHPPHAFLLLRSLSRRWKRSPKLPCPSRVGVRFWASLTLCKLANASGRIVFNIVLFMDWQFVSGCLPPSLSTTQLPSTTDSQCSVRWGLPPHCWCALSGAHRAESPSAADLLLGRFGRAEQSVRLRQAFGRPRSMSNPSAASTGV